MNLTRTRIGILRSNSSANCIKKQAMLTMNFDSRLKKKKEKETFIALNDSKIPAKSRQKRGEHSLNNIQEPRVRVVPKPRPRNLETSLRASRQPIIRTRAREGRREEEEGEAGRGT